MLNLNNIVKRMSEDDLIRIRNAKNPPKYQYGFEKEVRTETFWDEPRFRDMLIERRTGQF